MPLCDETEWMNMNEFLTHTQSQSRVDTPDSILRSTRLPLKRRHTLTAHTHRHLRDIYQSYRKVTSRIGQECNEETLPHSLPSPPPRLPSFIPPRPHLLRSRRQRRPKNHHTNIFKLHLYKFVRKSSHHHSSPRSSYICKEEEEEEKNNNVFLFLVFQCTDFQQHAYVSLNFTFEIIILHNNLLIMTITNWYWIDMNTTTQNLQE